ncbi:restriction endonuclease subunit S [Atlantibacter hermannii]|uniref:restriction endonuclease subunit S n=1 Tax=Atlantibacter hermannii TaxID=565 RepID=UPI0028A815F3|nr:restriction endonuclease subunit S [Atlantibacter hermannii]
MAKYKAYPKYKDSGVEWLGAIPEDWSVTKLKYIADLLTAKYTNSDDLFVGLENISSGDGKFISKEENIADGASVSFEKNDVLFGKLRPYLAKSWLATFSGVCSSEFLVLRTAKLHPKYLNYYSLTNEFIEQVNSSTYGSKMPRASWEFIGLLPVPTCSYSLSEKVACFLDHETAKIDKLIERQNQLIELLKEKRQAVISHAVTKGLNPDVPMKDSGVEWLGDIPSHWLCTKIKHIALLTPKKSSVDFKNNDECTFIPMEKLKRNSLVTDESKLIRDVISGYTYFEDDDLLLAKVTPCFENKNIAVAKGLVNSIGFGSTEIYVLRPTEKIRVNYLLFRLQEDNFIRAATAAMTGAGGLRRVPSDFLLNYPIAIPPKPEMDAIVAYLNAQEVHYDLMEKNATQAVQLLQERRTALISAAVTGKIDVRDWVAPDTQDVEEPQEATA